MKKIILWSVIGIFIAGIAVAGFWWLRRPQVMVLENGDTLKLLGVDYGKHHAAPAGGGRMFTTTNDELVVWIRKDHKPGENVNRLPYYVYDESGVACVPASIVPGGAVGNLRQAVEIQGIRFDVFPRRQGKFYMARQDELPDEGEATELDKKLVISNPARGPFPQWAAEPLPDTKEDGDLSVTLTKLVSGVPIPFHAGDPDNLMNTGVQAVFRLEHNGKAVTNWQMVAVETSDATGNRLAVASSGQNAWRNGFANNNWQDGDYTVLYQWGLWPDEPAWKVRVEFSQQSEFADDELWTVQNIPFQPGPKQEFWNFGAAHPPAPTGSAFAEADLNGYHVKIFPAKQFTDIGQNQNPQGGQSIQQLIARSRDAIKGGLIIQTEPQLPDGTRLTLVKLTDNQTKDIQHLNYHDSAGYGNTTLYTYGLTDISGLTNLNLTLALHKSRFVEFTAKPEKAAAK
jgi:hypothetical protein